MSEVIASLTDMADGYKWLVLAMLLAVGEVVVPGVLLIWFSIGAVIVGLLTLVFGLGIAMQLGLAAVTAFASVTLGRIWYRKHQVTSEDPLLNDRGARMVGKIVTVVEAITATEGRAKVGDSVWPARGAAIESGRSARIIAVEDGVLILEES